MTELVSNIRSQSDAGVKSSMFIALTGMMANKYDSDFALIEISFAG